MATAAAEAVLAQVLQSRAFSGSPGHKVLLRHLVKRALANDLAALKESVIAVEVFGRSASDFDARIDSIVRVQTRRLRARLNNYFKTEGRDSTLFIELPVGSYVPLIAARTAAEFAPEATRRARDLVERGEHFLRQRLGQESIEQALERFDAALRESPDFVPALVGAARAWFNLAMGWYRSPRVAGEHAAEALRRALAIDNHHAVAHALLGAIEYSFEHNWPAARRSFERGVQSGAERGAEGSPELAFVHSAYGYYLKFQGDTEAAERHLSLARRLDPQYINTRFHVVNLRLTQGRFDDAQTELDAIRDLAPDSMPLAGTSGVLALLRGDGPAAIAHYRRACKLAPEHPGCWASLAAAQGFAGDIPAADATMAEVAARFGPDATSPYVLAIVATRCGRPDQAFALLQRAVEAPDPNAVMVPTDLSFASLHGDARWPGLVAALARPIKA